MRIALLEDDQSLAKAVSDWLSTAGFQCTVFANGLDLMASLDDRTFDLALLDWHVPGLNGLEVLKRLRAEVGRRLPVLFVTVRADEEDVVTALDAGADDYITKPVRQRELTARVMSLLRRASIGEQAPKPFRIAGLEIDGATRTIRRGSTLADLTPREFELASYILRNPDRLLTRAQILEVVWGQFGNVETRTVDIHVSRLRTKLELRPSNGIQLESVHGVGYRLVTLPPEA